PGRRWDRRSRVYASWWPASRPISPAATPKNRRTVKVWDAQTGHELLSLKGRGSNLVFSPDGKRLAGTASGTVQVWEAQTGQELVTLKGHTGSIRAWVDSQLVFSPDGKRLASLSTGWDEQQGKAALGEVRVWDAQTGRELLTLKGGGGN